jgi:hypothetical protein
MQRNHVALALLKRGGGTKAHRNVKVSAEHAGFIDACFEQDDREAAFDLDQRLQLIQSRP